MRAIPLIHGTETIVSDEDYARLSQYVWRAIESKPGYIYVCRNERGRRIRMHREVCPPGEGQVVDHINGNTLDNRRENLRAVTNAENLQNITKPPRAGTGHRNVFRHKSGFIVRAYRNGEKLYGGWHSTLDAALRARAELLEVA